MVGGDAAADGSPFLVGVALLLGDLGWDALVKPGALLQDPGILFNILRADTVFGHNGPILGGVLGAEILGIFGVREVEAHDQLTGNDHGMEIVHESYHAGGEGLGVGKTLFGGLIGAQGGVDRVLAAVLILIVIGAGHQIAQKRAAVGQSVHRKLSPFIVDLRFLGMLFIFPGQTAEFGKESLVEAAQGIVAVVHGHLGDLLPGNNVQRCQLQTVVADILYKGFFRVLPKLGAEVPFGIAEVLRHICQLQIGSDILMDVLQDLKHGASPRILTYNIAAIPAVFCSKIAFSRTYSAEIAAASARTEASRGRPGFPGQGRAGTWMKPTRVSLPA